MRIAVTGAEGGLGVAFLKECANRFPGWERVGLSRKEADLEKSGEVVSTIVKFRPEIILHGAAMTAVDACETEKELAWRVNVEGTRAVCEAARQCGAKVVYISTDYVFDGSKPSPYVEDDPVNPQSVYGKTKREGEVIVSGVPRSLIVRTSWLYGRTGKSFPATILKMARERKELRIVSDQTGGPTYSRDLADALLTLIDAGAEGVFHVANSGYCTWFEFARAALELKGIQDVQVTPIATAELGRPAPRPANSRLNCARYEEYAGFPLRHWRDALADAMAEVA